MTRDKDDHAADSLDAEPYDSDARKIYPDVYEEVERLIKTKSEFNAEDRLQDAREVLFDLFSSVTDPHTFISDRFPYRKPVRWRYQFEHGQFVTHLEMFSRVFNYEFDQEGLRDAVAQYLSRPWMHTQFLDWFCASTLTYREYLATVNVFYVSRYGILHHVLVHMPGESWATKWTMLFGWSLLKWGIWLVVMWRLAERTGLLGPLILLVITAFWIGLRIFEKLKMDKILDAMLAAHRFFDTIDFSWKIAYKELDKARELGAKWDHELWKLVEAKGGME